MSAAAGDKRSRKEASSWKVLMTLFLTVVCLLAAGCGSYESMIGSATDAKTVTGVIPGTFFGMSINKFALSGPTIPFPYGTTRTWDAYPSLNWSALNPGPAVYNFAPLDDFIEWHKANSHAEIIYTLGNPPAWASAQADAKCNDGPGTCAPPENLSAWDNYIKAIATHSKGRIHIWELWNEPQDEAYYKGDITTMVTLAKHTYQIIKAIDPNAIILSPSCTGGSAASWMRSFLDAGGGAYMDVLAFHGYWDATAESIVPIVSKYRALMNSYGISDKPMWDTEANWAGVSAPAGYDVRAGFVAKHYLLHWSLGVNRYVWYMYDNPSYGGLWEKTSGLHLDGVAYQQTENWMVGARMTKACSVDGAGLWSCTLSRDGGYTAQVLWNSTKAVQFLPPTTYKQYRSLTGAVTSLSGTPILVGDLPILLESGTPPGSLR